MSPLSCRFSLSAIRDHVWSSVDAEDSVALVLDETQGLVEPLLAVTHDTAAYEGATEFFKFLEEALPHGQAKFSLVGLHQRAVLIYVISLPSQIKGELHHIRRESVERSAGQSDQLVLMERSHDQMRVVENARADFFP